MQGRPGQPQPELSIEQAFDVAAFVDSMPRPQKANLEADFPARKNKPVDSDFPPYLPGISPTQQKYGPFKPLLDERAKVYGESPQG